MLIAGSHVGLHKSLLVDIVNGTNEIVEDMDWMINHEHFVGSEEGTVIQLYWSTSTGLLVVFSSVLSVTTFASSFFVAVFVGSASTGTIARVSQAYIPAGAMAPSVSGTPSAHLNVYG